MIGSMSEDDLLERITVDPAIFGGKPIIRGRRLAVEHVLAMLAAGDSPEEIMRGYPWLEREDILACLAYARRVIAHERVEPALESGRWRSRLLSIVTAMPASAHLAHVADPAAEPRHLDSPVRQRWEGNRAYGTSRGAATPIVRRGPPLRG
jgi:uncharacterized protein (DUF433 family)